VQPQNDQAEEIRLIRRFDTLEQRLDTLEEEHYKLEQKHGDLQKKHDGMVQSSVVVALSCLLTFLGYHFSLFFSCLHGDRSGIRTLNLAIELVSPAPPPSTARR
jgi:hypothetical protein